MTQFIGGGASVPIGTIAAHPANIPGGWLECDGSAISRTDYAGLFAEIGTNYGAGDGSTTFNLPDLRGEFVRGADNGRGVDSGRVLGSAQADAFKSHSHVITTAYGGSSATGFISRASTSSVNDTKSSNNNGDTETRPRNVAMYYAIKY